MSYRRLVRLRNWPGRCLTRSAPGWLVFGLLAVAAPALAQLPPAAPPLTQVPPGSPLPRVLPELPPAVAPAVPPSPIVPGAQVPARTVRIARVVIEGVTAYPAGAFAPFTQGLTGPAVPLASIDAARLDILRRYRADGYVLSTVSVSVDTADVLHFVVTEGRIASVKLSGDIGPAGTQVLRFLRRLTETQPIDSLTLERYLLLAQDVPGITLHAVLQPSTEVPGAVTLIAQVSRQPVSGLALMDNRASPFTGPLEALAVLDLNSFTEFGEKTELSFYHGFPNTENFGQASTEAFIGSSGLKARIYAGSGPTVPRGVFAAEGYHGLTTVFGGALIYPIIRSRQQTLNVTGSFDGLVSAISTTTSGVRRTTSYDSLRVARLSFDYARSDLLLGDDRNAVDLVSVRLSQGLPILGASPKGASNAPRVGERIDFFKVNFELQRTQTLFYPFPNTSVALMGLLVGQISPDILPPEEQFYLGGSSYTRGYYSGQVTGDKALAATAELQLDTGFNLTKFGLTENVSTQFYLFYDWGETWQNQAHGLAEHISSAGGGVRMVATRYLELDFEGVARFNRFPTGTGANVSPLFGGAFYWRALARF